MSEPELKPCPFCGSDEISHGWSSSGYDGSMYSGNVECHSCDALIIADTEAQAIAAWNTRHREAADAASKAREAALVELVSEAVVLLDNANGVTDEVRFDYVTRALAALTKEPDA